jgi:hypothetical protein
MQMDATYTQKSGRQSVADLPFHSLLSKFFIELPDEIERHKRNIDRYKQPARIGNAKNLLHAALCKRSEIEQEIRRQLILFCIARIWLPTTACCREVLNEREGLFPHCCSRDADGLRASEVEPAVEDVDGNGDLGGLGGLGVEVRISVKMNRTTGRI